jgi:hypothetical protein
LTWKERGGSLTGIVLPAGNRTGDKNIQFPNRTVVYYPVKEEVTIRKQIA